METLKHNQQLHTTATEEELSNANMGALHKLISENMPDLLERIKGIAEADEHAPLKVNHFATCDEIQIPIAWKFKKSDLYAISINEDVEHIKFYAGVKKTIGQLDQLTLIAVGVDHNNNDLTHVDMAVAMYDFAQRCPPNCSNASLLSNAAGVHEERTFKRI